MEMVILLFGGRQYENDYNDTMAVLEGKGGGIKNHTDLRENKN